MSHDLDAGYSIESPKFGGMKAEVHFHPANMSACDYEDLAKELRAFYKAFWSIEGGEDWMSTAPDTNKYVAEFFAGKQFLSEEFDEGEFRCSVCDKLSADNDFPNDDCGEKNCPIKHYTLEQRWWSNSSRKKEVSQ